MSVNETTKLGPEDYAVTRREESGSRSLVYWWIVAPLRTPLSLARVCGGVVLVVILVIIRGL